MLDLTTDQQRFFMQLQTQLITEEYLVDPGFSTDPHLTLYQTQHALDSDAVRATIKGGQAITGTAGIVHLFPADEQRPQSDVVVLTINSPGAERAHAQLCRAFGEPATSRPFRPHVTLAYVEPGSHLHLDGLDVQDTTLLFDELILVGGGRSRLETYSLSYQEADDDDD